MTEEHHEDIRNYNILEDILSLSEQLGCLKCAVWDMAARNLGKRGMCGDCFNIRYVRIDKGIGK